MRATPLWHLLFGLFVNTHSLPDWSIDTQRGEIAASESLLGNAIENPFIALGSLNGINNGVNVAEGISRGCAPDTMRLPSKQKARRDNMCPADRLEFKNGGGGRQILPIAPSGQQGVGGGNSGGNGSGEPRVSILRFPGPEDPLQDVFIPEKIRPRENEEVCPQIDYHVPVCAREADAYISTFPVPGDTILDPCHLCKILKIQFFVRFFIRAFKLMQRCEFAQMSLLWAACSWRGKLAFVV